MADSHVEHVLRLCRKIVAAFSHSWKRKRELRHVQEQNDIPTKKLLADVSTRWGSTADMIFRILEQKEAIRIVLGQDRKAAHLVPTWQDLDVLVCVFSDWAISYYYRPFVSRETGNLFSYQAFIESYVYDYAECNRQWHPT